MRKVDFNEMRMVEAGAEAKVFGLNLGNDFKIGFINSGSSYDNILDMVDDDDRGRFCFIFGTLNKPILVYDFYDSQFYFNGEVSKIPTLLGLLKSLIR